MARMTPWIILMGLMILAACSESAPQDKIVIGVSAPLSGFASTMGEYVTRGVTLALEDLSPEERSRFEIVYEDDQCSATEGLSIAKKLTESEGVQYLIGPFCASVIIPTLDLYDRTNTIRMITGLGLDSYEEHGNGQFVLLGDTQPLMNSLADYVIKNDHTRIGMIVLDQDYGWENARDFEDAYDGAITGKESFLPSESDFRTRLLKLKGTNPEAILVIALGRNLIDIVRQVHELDWDIQLYGIRNMEDPEILRTIGKLSEGIIYPSLTEETAPQSDFYQRYLSRYGEVPESVAANAYDSTLLLIESILSCDNQNDCVLKTIRNHETLNGASGSIRLTSTGKGIRDVTVRAVRDGQFKKAPA